MKGDVRDRRRSTREAFVPLYHPPGHAQVDFRQAEVDLGSERRRVHVFRLIRPQSNAWFVRTYPPETTEAFLDGHVSLRLLRWGAILCDNTTLAVARIMGDGERRRTQAFTHLQSHYLFQDRFGWPGKGKVETLVNTARRTFLFAGRHNVREFNTH